MSLIVFDLDGTLIDGYAGIADALGYAMSQLGLAPVPFEKVRGMVGHGIDCLLEKAVGVERAPEGVRLFRRRYAEVAIAKTTLMPDVPQVLERLQADGFRMAVASNKLAEFSREILDAKGIGHFFFAVAGPDRDTPVKPDPAMLRHLMEAAGASANETVAVGDMEVDAEFARAAGCRVVLVPGGSRSREELAAVEGDALLDRLADLPDWLAKFAPSLHGRGPG